MKLKENIVEQWVRAIRLERVEMVQKHQVSSNGPDTSEGRQV